MHVLKVQKMSCSRKLPFVQQGGESQCDSTGALSAQQEISWKMIQKIRTKTSGGKSNGTEITGNSETRYTSHGVHLFRKLQKMLFYSLPEISGNSNRNSPSKGKRS